MARNEPTLAATGGLSLPIGIAARWVTSPLSDPLLLVTGATGYVGGRLVNRLVRAGYRVRVMVRDESRLQGRSWQNKVEVVVGDALRADQLPAALEGVDYAYYLIHSMADTRDFPQRELTAARTFGAVAKASNVKRIIYLGGLGDSNTKLSKHLTSRQATGHALAEAGVPVTEFRAAIVVGSGSVSFELIRNLTERLPFLMVPRWMSTRIQPISIRNVLSYLIAAVETPKSAGQIIEIGGPQVLTYVEMMLRYAELKGLRRRIVYTPFWNDTLYAYLISWITPVPLNIARPLIAGLRNEVVVRSDNARRLFPYITPLSYDTAVQLALGRSDSGETETAWHDALVTTMGDKPPKTLSNYEGLLVYRRQYVVAAPPEMVYNVFTGLGGSRGWLYANWTWQIRGMVDRLIGGVGTTRGRRHPDQLHVGDVVDFFRVELVEIGRRLLLRTEMRNPGNGWLQFEAQPLEDGSTRLVQSAFFEPKGIPGLAYWYLLLPVHELIFKGLVREVDRRAKDYRAGAKRIEAKGRVSGVKGTAPR